MWRQKKSSKQPRICRESITCANAGITVACDRVTSLSTFRARLAIFSLCASSRAVDVLARSGETLNCAELSVRAARMEVACRISLSAARLRLYNSHKIMCGMIK